MPYIVNKLKNRLNGASGRRKSDAHNMDASSTSIALASIFASLMPTNDSIELTEQFTGNIIQNFVVFWLDSKIDGLQSHSCETIIRVREIVNSVNPVQTLEQCIEFINGIEDEAVFVVVSSDFGQTAVAHLHDLPKVNSIYLFCEDQSEHVVWAHTWPKVKNVFKDISSICETIRKDATLYDRNTIPISFLDKVTEKFDEHEAEMPRSFMFAQIVKEIVLKMNFSEHAISEFNSYYRMKIKGNIIEQKNMSRLEKQYRNRRPIWWYTHHCLLSSIINHAVRTMDPIAIMKMAFFIHDLHKDINKLYLTTKTKYINTKPLIVVYRGQGISPKIFDELNKSQNRLVSFNNFLLTSKNYDFALRCAYEATHNSELIGMIFAIKLDPSQNTSPYASIADVSCYPTEEDFLFSINSTFKIGQLQQVQHNGVYVWKVELILSKNSDPEMNFLREHVLEAIAPNRGWCRLSAFFIIQDDLYKAEQVCHESFPHTNNPSEKEFLLYQLGLLKFREANYDEAKSYFQASLQLNQKRHSPEHLDAATCYNDIALVYEKMGNYTESRLSFEKALNVYERILRPNDPLLIDVLDSLGRVYFQMGEYSKSLIEYEKVLEACKNIKKRHTVDIAAAYSKIAFIHETMGNYPNAISAYETSLLICLEKHPEDHSRVAQSLINIGLLFEQTLDYASALTHYKQALEIYEQHLSLNQLDRAICHRNIASICCCENDHVQALEHFEKAHEIYRNVVPANDPALAAFYLRFGTALEKMGDPTKAALNYKQALDIYQNLDPVNHVDLAAASSSIGDAYFQNGDYSSALTFFTKSLDIYQKHLPRHLVDITACYIQQGNIYEKMGDNERAVSSYQSALDIQQNSFSLDTTHIQIMKDTINKIKRKNRYNLSNRHSI